MVEAAFRAMSFSTALPGFAEFGGAALFIIVALTGAALGSFASVLIYRVPRGLPWAALSSARKPGQDAAAMRSFCPSCRRPLGFLDLIPLVSWAAFKGRCRACGVKIPPFYPLLEIALIVAALIVFGAHGGRADTFWMLAALPFLAALAVIDLRMYLLPDSLVGALGGIALARMTYQAWEQKDYTWLIDHMGAGVIYGALAALLAVAAGRILKKDALGFGDVKFMAIAGMWLGLSYLPAYYALSGMLGVCFGLIWKIKTGRDVFPFGPALIAAFFVLSLSH